MNQVQTVLSASVIAALATFSGSAIARPAAAPASARRTTTSQRVMPSGQNQAQPQKTKRLDTTKSGKQPETLQAVKVVGIARSQMRSIQLKRTSNLIEDSITAVNIGQLPDITIANSLQRITGVQINRTAGEGTSVNINGLPEVETLLNGNAFLDPSNIDSIQPNYEDLPSSLFDGVDVYKSSMATLPRAGISGTINLRTRQPFDTKFGWTVSATAEAERGSVTKDTRPNVNALISYNAHGRWAFLVAASYSNLEHNWGTQGVGGAPGIIAGENSNNGNGAQSAFLTSWFGREPSTIHHFANGAIDVNGDGKSNGAFYVPGRFRSMDETINPKRTGLDVAFQAGIGDALTFTADGFMNYQNSFEGDEGLVTIPVDQRTATTLPLVTRNTGIVLHNPDNTPNDQQGNWDQDFFTTQVYNLYNGGFYGQSDADQTKSGANNFDFALQYDDGGPFTASLRFNHANARSSSVDVGIQTDNTDGTLWPQPFNAGFSGPANLYNYPDGEFIYNPDGQPYYTYATVINMEGNNPTFTPPAKIAQELSNMDDWVWHGLAFTGDSERAAFNIFRFTGHYRFSRDAKVDFGASNSIRSASDLETHGGSPLYAGQGASSPGGCLVHYTYANDVASGQGVPGACTAGNDVGFYRNNPYHGALPSLPAEVSDNVVHVVNAGDTTGADVYAINPNAARNPMEYVDKLFPNSVMFEQPSSSWDVLMKTRSVFAQADLKGSIGGMPARGNVGFRMVRTWLGVTQHLNGASRAYGIGPAMGGAVHTHRIYTDILPSFNLAVNITPKFIARFAAAKNMMPLTLDEWGGGFTPEYQFTLLPNGSGVDAITAASESGNPKLKPWRSRNMNLSLEYYLNAQSMASLSVFQIHVASFIEQSSHIVCDLPDEDGVVRDRCVPVSGPTQGTGATLHGLAADYQEALTFLPGILSHTGFKVDATYSPSDSNSTDLAGRAIPFPDNSKYSGNVVVWLSNSKWNARVAYNYRSTEAVSENYGGIQGLEMYEEPTRFIDASVSYQVNKTLRVFLQGANLTNTRQHFYLVWPDQKLDTDLSEREVFAGVSATF